MLKIGKVGCKLVTKFDPWLSEFVTIILKIIPKNTEKQWAT